MSQLIHMTFYRFSKCICTIVEYWNHARDNSCILFHWKVLSDSYWICEVLNWVVIMGYSMPYMFLSVVLFIKTNGCPFYLVYPLYEVFLHTCWKYERGSVCWQMICILWIYLLNSVNILVLNGFMYNKHHEVF